MDMDSGDDEEETKLSKFGDNKSKRRSGSFFGDSNSPDRVSGFGSRWSKKFLAADNDDDDQISVSRTSHFTDNRPATGRSMYSVRPMTAQSGDLSANIPDLEELRAAAEPSEAVEAPFVAVNNLYSYQELEKDLMKNAAFSSFDDLDFNPLFSRLLPESEIGLDDEAWTWDKLVASVSSSLQLYST